MPSHYGETPEQRYKRLTTPEEIRKYHTFKPSTETPEEKAADIRQARIEQEQWKNPGMSEADIIKRVNKFEADMKKKLAKQRQVTRSGKRINKLRSGYPLSTGKTTRDAPATESGTTLSRNLKLYQEGRSPVGDVVPSRLLGPGGGQAYNQGPIVRTAWPPGATAPTMVFGGPINPNQTGLMNLNLRQGGAMPAGQSGKGGL